MRKLEITVVAFGMLGWIGCGSDAERASLPYDANLTALIGGKPGKADGRAIRVAETPDRDECLEHDGECIKPQKECGDSGSATVLLDDSGKVVDVICYPTSGVSVDLVEGEIDRIGNNVVLMFDDEVDGADVTGDLTIAGNNVTLYGSGPDTAVIAGNLNIEKNNASVRGVRIEGDVTVAKNNASIVDCVIEGDLRIRGNNTSVALCEVWGEVVIDANNTVLVSDHFAKAPEVHGNNTVCASSVTFMDADDDGVVGQADLGDPVVCPGKSKGR